MLGSSPEAVELAGDKAAPGATRLAARGIDTPPCRIDRSARGIARRRSLSGRPETVDGAGSVDTYLSSRIVRSLPRARPVDGKARCLQPFVPGQPMSASFLVDMGGQGLADRDRGTADDPARWPLRVPGRTTAGRAMPWTNCPLRSAVESIPGLRGFVGVDFIWDERSSACDRAGDQPQADDVDRRPDPAAPARPTGVGLDRRVRSRWRGSRRSRGLAEIGPLAATDRIRCLGDGACR